MADIELVIKIPEKDYKCLKESEGCRWSKSIIDGVINGTPLPKGHGRLIDSDALDIDNLNRAYGDNFELDFGRLYTTDVVDMIDNAPTLIEADTSESEEA